MIERMPTFRSVCWSTAALLALQGSAASSRATVIATTPGSQTSQERTLWSESHAEEESPVMFSPPANESSAVLATDSSQGYRFTSTADGRDMLRSSERLTFAAALNSSIASKSAITVNFARPIFNFSNELETLFSRPVSMATVAFDRSDHALGTLPAVGRAASEDNRSPVVVGMRSRRDDLLGHVNDVSLGLRLSSRPYVECPPIDGLDPSSPDIAIHDSLRATESDTPRILTSCLSSVLLSPARVTTEQDRRSSFVPEVVASGIVSRRGDYQFDDLSPAEIDGLNSGGADRGLNGTRMPVVIVLPGPRPSFSGSSTLAAIGLLVLFVLLVVVHRQRRTRRLTGTNPWTDQAATQTQQPSNQLVIERRRVEALHAHTAATNAIITGLVENSPSYPRLVTSFQRTPRYQYSLSNLMVAATVIPPSSFLLMHFFESDAVVSLLTLTPVVMVTLTASGVAWLKPTYAFVALAIGTLTGLIMLISIEINWGHHFVEAASAQKPIVTTDYGMLFVVLLYLGFLLGAAVGWGLSVSRNS